MEHAEGTVEALKFKAELLQEGMDHKEQKEKRLKRIIWIAFILGHLAGLYGGWKFALL